MPASSLSARRLGGRFTCRLVWAALGLALLTGGVASPLWAQAPSASRLTPNLVGNIERPLRYHPDNGDFVIENGGEYFNRPLYGGNTAFRVDAGDMPEFSLYLPGRGGNLRFGLKTADGAKWLHEAKTVTSRYRPGEMLYEIRDPWLGSEGLLRLTAVALSQTEGLVVRLSAENIPSGVELVFAYGGVNGKRGKRDGDIGTEAVPIGEYFQLKPEFCANNEIELLENGFNLTTELPQNQTAAVRGTTSEPALVMVGDAAFWTDCGKLLGSSAPGTKSPVFVATMAFPADRPLFLALQRLDSAEAGDLDTYREVTAPDTAKKMPIPAKKLLPAFAAADLPQVFADAEAHFAALRRQILVETPDPYLNAAVGALNVAADAVWDEPQQAIMHGAIAWRTKLLGWRGPYSLDALGWHDRARKHFRDWAARQNVSPVPVQLPPADEKSNLSRNEAGLHSNGDISNSHYDMNLVFIDALFRHLRWTGDLDFAREMWPMIERHLAWERRLFRREFTTASGEKLPLYEAYAAIWASDDLQYSGGGTAHASAYNYFHNREAAKLARRLGHDPAQFAREADLIARGMRELLWQPKLGTFAEYKDLLGCQLVHPSAALWTVYHTIDSEVPTLQEAAQMVDYVETKMPFLPVRGSGVPDFHGKSGVYASSNWMPYSWSINNVVMGENVHTALAFWRAQQGEKAYALLESSLLASMYMGVCPGNVGSMNYLDVYRRESQRDFADGCGVLSRAIVEGLFGIKPDALAGELLIEPAIPWDEARIEHPFVNLTFKREHKPERRTLVIEQKSAHPLTLRIKLPVLGADTQILVNGQKASLAEGSGVIDVVCGHERVTQVVVTHTDTGLPKAAPNPDIKKYKKLRESPQAKAYEPLDFTGHLNDRVTEIFRPGKYRSPRSSYVSLALPAQGIGAWAGHVNAMAEIDDSGLRRVATEHAGRLNLPNGVSFVTPGSGEVPNIFFVSQWDNYPHEATIPLTGKAARVHLLMAGSTNPMQSRLDNGEVVATYTDGSTARLALRNPETWWPIEQDYFIDDYQFRINGPLPTRVDLKTGVVRVLDAATFKGQGGAVPGGAATVLSLRLDPAKELKSLTVRALANEVVIGLMAATLERHQ